MPVETIAGQIDQEDYIYHALHYFNTHYMTLDKARKAKKELDLRVSFKSCVAWIQAGILGEYTGQGESIFEAVCQHIDDYVADITHLQSETLLGKAVTKAIAVWNKYQPRNEVSIADAGSTLVFMEARSYRKLTKVQLTEAVAEVVIDPCFQLCETAQSYASISERLSSDASVQTDLSDDESADSTDSAAKRAKTESEPTVAPRRYSRRVAGEAPPARREVLKRLEIDMVVDSARRATP